MYEDGGALYTGCGISSIGSRSFIGNTYKYKPKYIHLIPALLLKEEGCVFELRLDMKREFLVGLIFNLNFSSLVRIEKQDFRTSTRVA